ncbi:MAG TPA: hypothetical protein VFM78_13300 [Marinobacter sp.]|nr:hypothetical protein [Marinobacter sp.]
MTTMNEFERPDIEPEAVHYPPEPDIYMPAMPPLRLIAVLECWWKRMRERWQFRKLYKPVLDRPDAQLQDVGLLREDILWAMALPLRYDAFTALERCRLARLRATGAILK